MLPSWLGNELGSGIKLKGSNGISYQSQMSKSSKSHNQSPNIKGPYQRIKAEVHVKVQSKGLFQSSNAKGSQI